ncbi:Hypothetical predicted protein [Drosophila guanche]|uniref:Uncharacterized protein n=1 Tax=Drosophila guanche TaxID=7266 RepID=A0A3B0JI97_DROGU|nr:Hypothetical predicted protein [Drosophila guanche]
MNSADELSATSPKKIAIVVPSKETSNKALSKDTVVLQIDLQSKEVQVKQLKAGADNDPAEDRKTLIIDFDTKPFVVDAQPTEEATSQMPQQIKIVFSLKMMRWILSEAKEMHAIRQLAKSGCRCVCHLNERDVKALTAEEAQNVRLVKEVQKLLELLRAEKPKKVISTLMKMPLPRKLPKLSKVRKLISGKAKQLQYKNIVYILYEDK